MKVYIKHRKGVHSGRGRSAFLDKIAKRSAKVGRARGYAALGGLNTSTQPRLFIGCCRALRRDWPPAKSANAMAMLRYLPEPHSSAARCARRPTGPSINAAK